ncbi:MULTISPECIES: dynamin family protein [unclassified Anabaena]|uniref:dynamin family protein n=1 Tax=unclassified Anabaena TaxID=2619674 RepID=UPI0014472D89|nr:MULTISPECIES: dynamin family protein [unclassified Anabaena]MTJ06524.1 dynamin family protein [Anabaena sp. UHCC 0204]MTJ54296.1 dynamin family protein [Anabaena sp. UHCC 0253]
MDSQTLKPNVQDLQSDVIDLLEQISLLMNRASTALSSDVASQKYAEFEQQVKQEVEKVKNLELRMAIVAPMKAGKSTITNAIIGQDILPSRNSAMTTLPTEIIFDAGLQEPILTLSREIVTVFQETLLALRKQINEMGLEKAQEKLAQYPHLQIMPKLIQKALVESVPHKSEGRKNIALTLTSLNDIVRLCSIICPSVDPLQSLTEVPRIRTPFWLSQTNQQSETLGKLVIVDTPGPNEAGENLRLQAVVAEQLRKSSMVLIVLDFTQLKNEAAEKVKKDVERVIDLRGKESLYVLINKVDQRRDGDMKPEQVQQFVAAEFGIGNVGDINRVFEISARRAFTSANFLMELQQRPDVEVSKLETSSSLAQEVFGIDWEEDLKEAAVEELIKKAEKLWKKSGFDPFLNGAINALMAEAAPRCIESALKISLARLAELQDDVQLRRSAMAQDEEKVKFEVTALETDLQSLEDCRQRLQEVDNIKTNLYQQLNKILETLKQKATVSLESSFIEEEYQRADLVKKGGMVATNFFNLISKRFNSQIKPTGSGVIEFNSLREAEDFAEQAIAYPKQRIDMLLDDVREQVRKITEKSRLKLTNFLIQETQPIIDRARQRLNEAFEINLSLPTLTIDSEDIDFGKVRVNSNTRWLDQGYENKVVEKRKFTHWLFLVPKKETIRVKRPDKKEDYYTVSLQEIIDQSSESIDQSVRNIKQGINQYLDEDFKQRVSIFFNDLDIYLSNYRESLIQSQQDQKLQVEEKEKLVTELDYLFAEAKEKNKNAAARLEFASDLIRNKQ